MSSDSVSGSLWEGVLSNIRSHVSEQQFETWFRGVEASLCSPDQLVLTVPNSFSQEWLRKHYSDVILKAAEQACGGNRPRLEVSVREGEETGGALEEALESFSRAAAVPATEAPKAPRSPWAGVHMNPDYRWDRFVVGSGNRVPFAAAEALLEGRSSHYSPLFIHGGVGIGKTHLLQALCQQMRETFPEKRVAYVPCEYFINEFIASVEGGDLERFRRRYRNLDVLLMDDVHFLAGKERTQDEFLHMFNTLHDGGRTIVLTADALPREGSGIVDRLASRFRWGMVCEMEQPTLETRLRIVHDKAAHQDATLDPEVAEYIAEHVRSNVRELEGAVVRVVGHATLTHSRITLDLAREALKDVAVQRRRRVSLDHISSVVTNHFGVRLAELQSKRRTQAIAVPRQVCMYLARRLTNHSLEEIGGYFGGRDHSTVLYANDKITKKVETDAALKSLVEQLGSRAREAASGGAID